jgi:sugar lactone lactonase YvrE
VPLGPAGRPTGAYEEVPLGGDFAFVPNNFNANGIVATPNGKTLIVVNSATGTLYTVDPETGEASTLEGVSTPSGDGLLLDGDRTLYVVQNFFNKIAVIDLNPAFTAGELVQELTDPDFRIPTTVAEQGRALYAVNARFDLGMPPPPGTEFEIVRVQK